MIQQVSGFKFTEEIRMGKLKHKHERNIRDAFDEYGKDVVNKISEIITSGSRTGRVYTFRGQQHQASASGEPPANRTGRLAGSFKYQSSQFWLKIYSQLDYAFFLEGGTVRMGRRPYFEITNVSNSYKLYRSLSDLHT